MSVADASERILAEKFPSFQDFQDIYHSAAAFHSPLLLGRFLFWTRHIFGHGFRQHHLCDKASQKKNESDLTLRKLEFMEAEVVQNLAKQQTSSQQMLYGLRDSIFLWNFGSKHTIFGKRLIFSLMHFQFGCLSIPKSYSTFQKVFLDLKIFWESIWWHQVILVVR